MEKFFIAQIGKTVGLRGDLKFHLHTDFPEQFKAGQTYKSDSGDLEILTLNPARGIIKFRGYETLDSAKKLTNTKLYANKEQTIENCDLAEGEHFWFEVIGASVMQEDELLGTVTEIQRLLDIDYLQVKTDKCLIDAGLASSFLIPYIPRYILSMDKSSKQILTQDAKDILEAS
ncbi:MAG: ribosome maturation factor RimM [Campylobacterota bacterium]|nr:ribosome maturation factor RimM [Campylobacterota bacterium]